mgnify:CR=1 FL=1
MDESVIKKIERMVSTQVFTPHNCKPFIVVPEGMMITPLVEEPVEFKESFKTSDIESFVNYIDHHRASLLSNPDYKPVCYISDSDTSAKIYLDAPTPDDPKKFNHDAALVLSPTSAYKALCRIHSESYSQKTAIEWMEDWHEHIEFYEDSVPMPFGMAINSMRDVTLERAKQLRSQVSEKSENLSAMEQIEAKAEALPNRFVFNCKQCNGLDDAIFSVKMRVDLSSDSVRFKFRIDSYDILKDEKLFSFKNKLTECLGASVPEMKFLIGSI